MDHVNLKRLSDEIKEFETYLAPTSYETDCRRKLLEKIQVIVQNTLNDATVEPFGSYETQLLLPSSDIDLNISVKNGYYITSKSILKKMDKALSKNRLRIQLRVFGATVPVLKVVEPKTGLTADITAMNNVISSKRTLAWIKEYPELKPLFLVLKHALLSIRFEWDENYEVLSTVKNGLASYSLVCMIVHYLKYDDEDMKNKEKEKEQQKKKTEEKDEEQDHSKTRLGRLLTGFLKYYSTFDFITNGLSLTSKKGVFEKISHPVFGAMNRIDEVMAIENPDEPTNNVARSTRTIKQFQAVLSWMYAQLNAVAKSDGSQPSLLGSIIGAGSHFLDRPRKNLTEYQFPLIQLTEESIGIYLPSVDPTLFANSKNNRRRSMKRKRFDEDDNNGDYYARRARYNRNDDVGYVRRDKYYNRNYDDDYNVPRGNKRCNQNRDEYGNRNGGKRNNDHQGGGGGKVQPPKRYRSYKQGGNGRFD